MHAKKITFAKHYDNQYILKLLLGMHVHIFLADNKDTFNIELISLYVFPSLFNFLLHF